MILSYALTFATGCFALALVLNLWRLMAAPTATDRVLAVDTMTVNLIALFSLYGGRAGLAMSFEPALLLAMTGFVGTVAWSIWLLRGRIAE